MFTRIPEWATRPPVVPEAPLVEFARPKPHIFSLHGKWHCTSAARYIYGVGATPVAAYWAARNVQEAAT